MADHTSPRTDAELAPYPGTHALPRWNVAELPEAPRFTWRHWFAMIGPGLVMGGAAIGGGEWLKGPEVAGRYGAALFWLATLSILGQVIYNIEISRYTLYTGEPIFTGKFRVVKRPWNWVATYLFLDMGSLFPYLAANAAVPVVVLSLGSAATFDPDHNTGQWWMLKGIAWTIFGVSLLPLIVGGKIYNSIKAIMSLKIVTVLGFLLLLAVLYTSLGTWREIVSGFFRFGAVPVRAAEDRNGNGALDPGEDWDGDGRLDVVEERLPPNTDYDGDGKPDKFVDVDGDRSCDGDNLDNIFVSVFEGRGFPAIDLSMIAALAAMVAIAGSGGLTNTTISNYTRDQGWGMGWHVGAIPCMIGGQHLELSHVGAVFPVNAETTPRWRRWMKHVRRDQLAFWMPACFIGLALPSMLSVEFLPRGSGESTDWNTAVMTSTAVERRVADPPAGVVVTETGLSRLVSGASWGNVFRVGILICGILVLAPSISTTADGVVRRWVDVFWTGSPSLQKLDPSKIRVVYFAVLACYGALGFLLLGLAKPKFLVDFAGMMYNFALGVSCLHVLCVNTILLPKELRPGWAPRVGLVLAGLFFATISTLAAIKFFGAWIVGPQFWS